MVGVTRSRPFVRIIIVGLPIVKLVIHDEVLIGLLECDPTSFLGTDRSWSPVLGDGTWDMEALVAYEIQKRYPGVRVYADAEGIHIRIRGSLQAPLYVVDGLAMAPTPSGALWGVSLHDIDSIEVVRDPARLSYYGIPPVKYTLSRSPGHPKLARSHPVNYPLRFSQ